MNGLQYSSVSVNNSSVDYIIDSNFNSGNYTWAINCYYSGGNISSTEIREFTIPDADSSSSDQQSRGSGGSGGGGGSSRNIPTDAKIEGKIYSIFTISEEDLKNKNTHSLKKNQALKFTIASAEHLLFFEKVEKNSIIFTVKSEPQQVILNVGEEKNFELNGDNYYDLFIRLDSIFGEDIRVSIQEVHSLISPENNLEVDISSNIDPEENENWYLFNYLIVGIIILVIFMIYMYFRRVRSIMAISRMLGDVERRQILSDSNSMGASVDDSFNQEK